MRVGIPNQRAFPELHSQEKTHWEFPETFSLAKTSDTENFNPNHSNLVKLQAMRNRISGGEIAGNFNLCWHCDLYLYFKISVYERLLSKAIADILQ